MENQEQKKAYKEVLIILEELNLKEQIPKEIINLLEENKDNNWNFKFDKNIPLEEQKILKETTKLLSILYLTYICKDKDEKNEIIKIYEETQRKKDKEYSDNLFKTKKQDSNKLNEENISKKNNTDVKLPIPKTKISYKIKNVIRRIKNFIKNVFKN